MNGLILQEWFLPAGGSAMSTNRISVMPIVSIKLYMGDVGLLTLSRISLDTILSDGDNLFLGALTELIGADNSPQRDYELHYWENNGTAELDFVLQKGSEIIGIEVKKRLHVRSRSLPIFVKAYTPAYCIRLSSKNFGETDGLKSIPLYAAFCI
jgi:predicted AAA+ superfamily ATPase